jgi:LPS O-antigen subunit length determinant protein (WzzB/FepE family)
MSTTEAVDSRIEERAQQRATDLEQQRLAQLRDEAVAEITAEEAEAERQREVAPSWLDPPEMAAVTQQSRENGGRRRGAGR